MGKYALPIIMTVIVLGVWIICAIYVKDKKKKGELNANKRWVDQLPSLVSTTGVLGTFIGITIGLLGFDADNIIDSIPPLLSGLTTAFFTSLVGMVGSLFLSRQVNAAFDETEKGISDSTAAATIVVNEIKNSNQHLQILCQNILQIKLALDKVTIQLASSKDVQQSINQEIANNLTPITKEITKLTSILPNIKNLDEHVGELLDTESAVVSHVDEISANVSKLGDKLHSEVVEIEDSMSKTNQLLSHKFDEFTELLKKSNTEALVEVMKKVTEEFQKQMGKLINKLVQENFDQLNKSVERLNTWQIENKEMISALTKQYKQMADNFQSTSTTLTQVGGDTKLLVSDGGKLKQIVEALNKVLVDDTRFIEISTKLADTASLTKENMQQFDESTKTLNDWVKKQRQFVDGVNLLIQKLDEINKINDYSQEFWKETKKGLNDAVGMIRGSVNSLNEEISNLDEHFYQRLSATLSELDTCMQAMINSRR